MISIFFLAALIATVVCSKLGIEPPTETDYVILAVLMVGDVVLFKNERGKRER